MALIKNEDCHLLVLEKDRIMVLQSLNHHRIRISSLFMFQNQEKNLINIFMFLIKYFLGFFLLLLLLLLVVL